MVFDDTTGLCSCKSKHFYDSTDCSPCNLSSSYSGELKTEFTCECVKGSYWSYLDKMCMPCGTDHRYDLLAEPEIENESCGCAVNTFWDSD